MSHGAQSNLSLASDAPAPLAPSAGSASDCRCAEYRAALERIAVFYRGGERATESMLEMRAIAKRALSSPSAEVSEAADKKH